MATQLEQTPALDAGEVNYADFGGDIDDGDSPASDETELAGEFAQFGDEAEADGDKPEGDTEQDGDDLEDLEDIEAESAEANAEEIDLGDGLKATKAELKEALEGKANYSRYADELKVVATERETLGAIREDFTRAGAVLEGQYKIALQLIASNIPQAPDPDLQISNPQLWIVQNQMREAALRQYEETRGQIDAAIKGVEKTQAEAQTKAEALHAQAEVNKLLKAVPALADGKKADLYLSSVIEAGKKYGYSDAEVKETVLRDHRAALILRKAALYDAYKAKLTKPIPQAGQDRRTIPAPSRSPTTSQKSNDRRSLNDVLTRVSSKQLSRSDALDAVASRFSD